MHRLRRGIRLIAAGLLACATASAQSQQTAQARLNDALLQALDAGQQARIVSLLKRGANPNMKTNSVGRTPLMEAAGWGIEDEIRILVKFGANVNARDTAGDTPLMYAVEKGRDDTIRPLLSLGADAKMHNKKGSTALTIAKEALANNWTTPFLHVEAAERKKIWKHIVAWLRQASVKPSRFSVLARSFCRFDLQGPLLSAARKGDIALK